MKLCVSDFSAAVNTISFNFWDLIISVFLIILLPIIIIYIKNKNNLIAKSLNRKLNFSSFTVIILLSFFIFAPLITNSNPNFQKDIGVTKLLPPLSFVNVLSLKRDERTKNNQLISFLFLKSKIVKNSFNEDLIFADSVKFGEPVILYQKGKLKKISNSKLAIGR